MTTERPYTLIAELTYRCALRCAYCSNPLQWQGRADGLECDSWLRVFREAERLGVVQLHLTGGEPLLRRDLEALIAGARTIDLYVHLITSGIPLTEYRLARLRDHGLDAVQLSIQGVTEVESDRIAGRGFYRRKLAVAQWVKRLGLPLTLNIVLHRDNLARIDAIVELAERLGADRLELANAQYLGWALVNDEALLPARDAIDRAREAARQARDRLRGTMEVLFVLPDYHTGLPRACMDGWARRYIVVTPDGLALPCHAAHTLQEFAFDRVQDRPLDEIWRCSPVFQAFRGETWMEEPCRSCPRRTVDFGGCRCQAYALVGNAAATDPACSLSPHHHLIEAKRRRASDSAKAPRYLHRGPAPR